MGNSVFMFLVVSYVTVNIMVQITSVVAFLVLLSFLVSQEGDIALSLCS